jgi:CHAT domain-containing protein/tetratricopeptide (TPR) repeat protein
MGFLTRLFGNKPSSVQAVQLSKILSQLLAAETYASLKRIFDQYPEILSDDFSNLVKRRVLAQTDPRAVQLLSQIQELIRLCRQYGVETAFGGLVKPYPTNPLDQPIAVPALLDEDFEHLADLTGQVRIDRSLNAQRIELIDNLLSRITTGNFGALRATLLNERSIAYQALPGADHQISQRKAIESGEEALRYNDPEKSPTQYAIIHTNLGTAHVNLVSGSLAQNLTEAVEHFEQALTIYSREKTPLEYAGTQLNLGTAYMRLPTGDLSANLLKTIACCREALTFLTADNAPFEFAKTNCCLAFAYLNLPAADRSENFNQALVCAQQAQKVLSPESAPYEYAFSELLLGAIFAEWSRADRKAHSDEAAKHLQAALSFFIPENYPFEYASGQSYLGIVFNRRTTGDPTENLRSAIKCFQSALTILTPEVSPWGYANARNNLGSCLAALPTANRTANLNEAIDCFESALTIFTPESNPSQYAATQTNLGNAHLYFLDGNRETNLHKAIACYREALRFRALEASPWEYANTQTNLGIAYRNLGSGDRAANLHQAIKCYQAALAVYTPESAPGYYARLQNNLGIVYENLPIGEPETNLKNAITAYKEALRFRTPESSPDEYAETNHNLGNAYSRLTSGDRVTTLQQAMLCYQEALRFWTETSRPTDFANLQLNMSNVYVSLPPSVEPERMEKAVDCVHKALRIYTTEASPLMHAYASINLGVVYSRSAEAGDETHRRRAIKAYEEALRYAPLEVVPADHRFTALRLGDLHFDAGSWEQAHDAYSGAITAGEMLYQSAATSISRMQELGAGGDVFAKDAYCLARLGRYAQAIERLEKGRARSLAEALDRTDAARQEADTDDQAAFLHACELLKSLEAEVRGLSTPSRDRVSVRSFLEISNEMLKARQALDTVVQRIRTYRPDFLPVGLDFKGIARVVPPSIPLIYLVATSRGSLSLIIPPSAETVDDGHVVWLDEFGADDLTDLLVQTDIDGHVKGGYLVGQVGDEAASFRTALTDLLSILREKIVRQLEDRLTTQGFEGAVLISGGRLSLLPLHAAFEKTVISYTPSARSLQTVRQSLAARAEMPPVLLGIGNPLPNPRPLAFARAEFDAIAQLYPEAARRVLCEEEATQSLLQRELPAATYLHFACHGAFDLNAPLLSAISLSGSDQVTLRDLLDGEFDLSKARLVVLSACQTGITAVDSVPDEVIALPAGFLQAGVTGAIATLWSVNDISTMLFMVKFYECHLGQLLAPAVALRNAQLWLRSVTNAELAELFDRYRKSSPGTALQKIANEQFRSYAIRDPKVAPFAHPYYWAAFALYGN